MGEMLTWWLAVEVLSLAGLPLSATLFARLPDRGWAFAKALSLVVCGWLVWLPLDAISALPYSRAWIVATFLIFGVVNVILYVRTPAGAALRGVVRGARQYVIAVETVFALTFALMGWLRAFTPAVVDTEKFMDEAFLSAIWRAPHLPPPDPWLSGYSINYYYFGHFLLATLAKVLGTVPAVTYNLGVALIFGLAAVTVFGLGANIVATRQIPRSSAGLTRWSAPAAGLVAVGLVLIAGNLDGAVVWWQQATAAMQAAGHVAGTVISSPWAWWLHRDLWATYDWWCPSRVVPSCQSATAITEFPAFSFILADLHAHVMALPFDALAIGIAFTWLLGDGAGLRAFGRGRTGLVAFLAGAVALGSLYLVNGWDLPTYLGLALLALLIQQWLAHDRVLDLITLLDAAAVCALVAVTAVLLYVPFYRSFASPSQGIGLVTASGHSPIGDVALIFGLPAALALSLLAVETVRWLCARSNGGRNAGSASSLPLNSPIVFAVAAVAVPTLLLVALTVVTNTFAGWTLLWAWLIIIACAAHVWRRLADSGEDAASIRAYMWPFCLVGTAAALVLVCEVVYLRDIFAGGPDYRMNTVFKLYYQAWLLLGVAGGPIAVWLVGIAHRTLRALHHPEAADAAFSDAVATGQPTFALTSFVGDGPGLVGTGSRAANIQPVARAVDVRLPTAGDGSRTRDQAWPGPLKRLGVLRLLGTGGIVMWSAAIGLLVAAALVYPVLAASARTANFTLSQTLDGTAYMATDPVNTGDQLGIGWLNSHVTGDAVIVEAAEYNEYTHYGRISAFTGLPTLLGWGGHEVQWRVNWLAQPVHTSVLQNRLDAVKQIYTSTDHATVQALLRQYNVRYVYVGAAERAMFPGANLDSFSRYLKVVYQRDGVTIYATR